MKRPKQRESTQAKSATREQRHSSSGQPPQQTRCDSPAFVAADPLSKKVPKTNGEPPQTRHQRESSSQRDSTTSSSASSSASSSSSIRHPVQQLVGSNGSVGCPQTNSAATPSELFSVGAAHPLLQPGALSSLNYGPFGLPQLTAPQGSSLLHFPPTEVNKSAPIQSLGSALNAQLVATQNVFEGLPIFVVPNANTLSLNALQRAAEFKAMAIGAMLQQQSAKPDTSKHFHVFVGDLSQEVDNQLLKEAFAKFGEVSEAKVMRDAQSAKKEVVSSVPPFAQYSSFEDAQRAIEGMNGVSVGRRPVRTGWAVRRGSVGSQTQSGSEDENKSASGGPTFESVFNATDADNTTIYLGGLSNAATEEPIRAAFSQFGQVKEIRLFASQNFGFAVFADKAAATRAILEMHGKELDLGIVGGKCTLRVKWGKPPQQGSSGGAVTSTSASDALAAINSNALAQLGPSAALVALTQQTRLLQQQQQQQLALSAAIAAAQQQCPPAGTGALVAQHQAHQQQPQFVPAQFLQGMGTPFYWPH